MTEVAYKNVVATVRTPRCAVLINENSRLWKCAVSGAIACASEVWGGRHFLIIPTDGNRIKNKFWEVLEAYSPDHIALYTVTSDDVQDTDANDYSLLKQKYEALWQKEDGGDGFDDWFETQHWTFDELTISPGLSKQLRYRLCPFFATEEHICDPLMRTAGFGFPFTKLAEIIGATTRPIGQIWLPRELEDATATLMAHAFTGAGSNEYIAALKKQDFAVDLLPDTYNECDFLEDVLLGAPNRTRSALSQAQTIEPYMDDTPFGLSMLHLQHYYPLETHTYWKEPATVVMGDTAEDFCLFYSLSRLHDNVYWMPLAWVSKASGFIRTLSSGGEAPQEADFETRAGMRLAHMFQSFVGLGTNSKRIELRSMSLSPSELEGRKDDLAHCVHINADQFAEHIDCVSIDQPSTHCVRQVFEENNYANNYTVVFSGNETVSPFPTPKPKNFSTVDPRVHRWLTSIQIEGYQPPIVPSLAEQSLLLRGGNFELRIARDGIVYFCPNIMYASGDIDVNLVRPKVRMHEPMILLDAYFATAGATIRYSDKGDYALDTIGRFGGLRQLGEFVKDPSTRGIFDKFMLKDNSKDDQGKSDGKIIHLGRENDQRAYLCLRALTDSLGGDAAAAVALTDELVDMEVLLRGYLLNCKRCRLLSWYGIDMIGNKFTCNRCYLSQSFTKQRWKHPNEPVFYYRLAETVYQFYTHHSDLPTQVLFKLQGESRAGFHFAPEVELLNFPGVRSDQREIDLACVLDGKFVIGEGKSGAVNLRDIERYKVIADRLPRRPDRVVFATTQELSEAAKELIESIPNSEVMTFDDLYDG